MKINHGNKTDFYREFLSVDIKKDGTVDLKVRTLNIVQRALRYLFGAYSNTIWNESKSKKLMDQHPKAWQEIKSSIESPDLFKSVFKIDKASKSALSATSTINASSHPSASAKKITPQERSAPESMSGWKQFGREQLQSQLAEIGLQFKESTEKGDCFFDSFAYLLTALRGDKQYTAQDVRTDISNYLQRKDVPHASYQKLLKANLVDGNTYEAYRENISKCATKDHDPIWGDDLAIQIVSDLYNVNINVYSSHMIPVTRDMIRSCV